VDRRQSSRASALKDGIRDYYEVTKPNVISLLVFTAIATVVIVEGSRTNPVLLLLVGAAVWLGSAGANTVGSYFDRDIDSQMNRTKKRPIPTGRISPGRHLFLDWLSERQLSGYRPCLLPSRECSCR
jgi:heme O synthase-like polyprenyltransferase